MGCETNIRARAPLETEQLRSDEASPEGRILRPSRPQGEGPAAHRAELSAADVEGDTNAGQAIATATGETRECFWCRCAFTPRTTGGRPQEHCSERCRRTLDVALRKWARGEFEAGRVTVEALKASLARHTG